MLKSKLAIIGASSGQLPIVKKATEMGIETHCFAWAKDAVCIDYCDFFHPISIFEYDCIASICRQEGIEGVVSNASEETALASAEIASRLNLICTPPQIISSIQNKERVRELTSQTPYLSQPRIWKPANLADIIYPCVIKPVKGSAKRGVSFCNSPLDLSNAIKYVQKYNDNYIVEEYIDGNEYSIECLSYKHEHHIIQYTQKITTGYPHFVELEHHQPATLNKYMKDKINRAVTAILNDVEYENGASHIEIKIKDEKIYLIEINPRGGGDRISDTLIELSTNCDYIRDIILISLGMYRYIPPESTGYSGILFLNNQNKRILPYFQQPLRDEIVEYSINPGELTNSLTNYDRNGYIIYKSDKEISF